METCANCSAEGHTAKNCPWNRAWMISTFGQRLRLAREERGLTLTDFASRVGISPGAMTKYEYGRSDPRMSKLKTMVEVLDCSADWLIGLD